MEAALWTPKSSNDDSKFVEFLSIHILLTPVWLVFILQYFSSPVVMTCKYFGYQAGQLSCSTFTGTSNEKMFQSLLCADFLP